MTMSTLPDERRVALITGCSRPDGIGWHTALALAKAGMTVMVTDVVRDAQAAATSLGGSNVASSLSSAVADGGLEHLVKHIIALGGECHWLQGDVSSEADASRLVTQTVERFGRLDVLVNNAAAPHGRDRSDIEDIPLDAWDRVMAINVRGVFLMSRAAIAHMRRSHWGRIVNVSSAVFRYGARHRTAYAASKAAVAGFSRSLAMDVAGSGITVNAVCPGSILTARARNTTGEMLGFTDLETGLAKRARAIPAGRHGRAEEVAATIAFLCSNAAGYITGQDLFIDGGGMPLPEFQEKAPEN
jgi:NAD(P)-dependent dehydrogenase (short-subunit alcohol dehydrogenase family)